MNRIPKVKQAKITRRQVAEPEFKKPGNTTVQKDIDIVKSQQNKLMKEYKAEEYDNLREQFFTPSEDERGDIHRDIYKTTRRDVNEA